MIGAEEKGPLNKSFYNGYETFRRESDADPSGCAVPRWGDPSETK
jgi:hypothetical protein